MESEFNFDVLIIGTGSAGLMNALQLDDKLEVALIAKDKILEGSSYYAQGGISAVLDKSDNFSTHINDTLIAGDQLGNIKAIEFMVHEAPHSISLLEDYGVEFTKKNNHYHLTTEGGHTKRRVAHIADRTGKYVQDGLKDKVLNRSNITIFEDSIAVDLLTKNGVCYGAYILDKKTNKVCTFNAKNTVLATGGASKVYLYTSNPDTSTGDGIAMAYRSGCKVVNMEFTQFHPTCLYHPHAKSFLITEAMRGEGAKLRLPNGDLFMQKYDDREEMAPRDIVARAIDAEMKINGFDHVYLDITFKEKKWIETRFPTINEKCKSFGIDISKDYIPVVPAAHYTCGGVDTDLDAKTSIKNLYAIGEVAHTGVHGANRMASNSLLECIVFAKSCAIAINKSAIKNQKETFKPWDASRVSASKEMVVVKHLWDEIRRLMWNFVGIVRSDKRLYLAQKRLEQIQIEINDYYSKYLVNNDLIELRNLAETASIIVKSALLRQESRGLHYNEDHIHKNQALENTEIEK